MNQVDKPENTDTVPKPTDIESSSYVAWKQLSTVATNVKASTELSIEEKDILIQLITSEDSTLISTINTSETQDALATQLHKLAQTRIAEKTSPTATATSTDPATTTPASTSLSTAMSTSSTSSTDTSSSTTTSTSTTQDVDMSPSTPAPSTEDVEMTPSTPKKPVSTPPSTATTTSTSPPPLSPTEAAYKSSITTITSDKKRGESCIKAIYKVLTTLKKKPSLVTNRKMRMDNIAVKKMMEVPGASTFMETVGFTQTSSSTSDSKTPTYLQIEKESDIDMQKLDLAIEKLEYQIAILEGRQTSTGEVKAAEPPKPAGPRIRCGGAGCNFFGDESTENLCSVCYKKKYFGTPTSTSLSATPAKKEVVPPIVTVLRCKSGCGFVGIESYGGQCSVCYKKDKEGKEPPKRWRRHFRSAMIKIRAMYLFNSGKRPAQVNKNRCYTCSKRVGITGIECRCSYIFCGKHRYPQEHECPFDYKSQQRKKLAKENEMITRKKMDKIGE